ncbi:hypothetical protein H8356DRAFT_938211 [Neocallimastix lanati (nom. inval.)]|nr:hypothetical protein H8356DRAFT_938211 [Neocallimastix sp. JGI-2020a]
MDNETIIRARKKYLFNEDENNILNDEEQEEIINTLNEKNERKNGIYSITIAIGLIILNLLFSYEIITNSFSILSIFIIFISWMVVCCAASSFRQYASRKYYVRLDDDEDEKSHIKRKYLEYFQIIKSFNKNGDGGDQYNKYTPKYKRYSLSDDQEIPLSPYHDVVNYAGIALSLAVVGLTIGYQEWLHRNFLVPFIPLILSVTNMYVSAVIDRTTTEINSLKSIQSPYKGA